MLQVANEQELAVVRQTFPEAEELFSRQRIAEHVTNVARIIAYERQAGGYPRPLKFLVVLDGAMPYGMDLGGELAAAGVSNLSVDTIQLSRYGDDTEPSQTPVIIKDLRYPITGEEVYVVEDILDGGLTLAYLKETILLPRHPASLKITALLRREGAQIPGTPESDYPVLSFPDDGRFAIGYGLDMRRGQARHYRAIYLVPKPTGKG